MSLFVGNLSKNVRSDDLSQEFESFGRCKCIVKVSNISLKVTFSSQILTNPPLKRPIASVCHLSLCYLTNFHAPLCPRCQPHQSPLHPLLSLLNHLEPISNQPNHHLHLSNPEICDKAYQL